MDPIATHGAFSWMEHSAGKAEKAKAFYENVLGWKIAAMPMKDGSTYHGIMVGERPVGGFAAQARPGLGWLAFVTVDNVDRRASKAAKAGAEILSEPADVPGVGRVAVLRDPFGASIALITYESAQR